MEVTDLDAETGVLDGLEKWFGQWLVVCKECLEMVLDVRVEEH